MRCKGCGRLHCSAAWDWGHLCLPVGWGGYTLLKLAKLMHYERNLIGQLEFFNSIQINENQWHSLKKSLKLTKINESIYSLNSSRLLQSKYIFPTKFY